MASRIFPYQVREVRRLWGDGCRSRRRIARRLGISREVVNQIVSGTFVLQMSVDEEPDMPMPDCEGSPVRCPGCGGKVFLPCRLCQLRELKREQLAKRRQHETFRRAA